MIDGKDEFARKLGQRLRSVRKRRGLSMAEVQELSNGEVGASVLGAYERGVRTLTVNRLQRLADLYRVNVETLLEPGTEEIVEPATPPVLPTARGTAPPGTPALCIDLAALDASPVPELTPLRRYIRTIRDERGNPDAATLTIRADDLRVVAALCGLDAVSTLLWLLDQGVLASRTRYPVTPVVTESDGAAANRDWHRSVSDDSPSS